MTKEGISRSNGTLDTWLAKFYHLNDPGIMLRIQEELWASWDNWVREHPYQALLDLQDPPPTPHEEEKLTQIRIVTSSPRKQAWMSKTIAEAGFTPVIVEPIQDEEKIHADVRRLTGVTKYFAMHIAGNKLQKELLHVPAMSLDTMTIVDSVPLGKPHSIDSAKRMIRRITGREITTATGFVIGMPFRTGRTSFFFNQIELTYTMRHLTESQIAEYVSQTIQSTAVAGGIDLSNVEGRTQFIDLKKGIRVSGVNFVNERDELLIPESHIGDPVLDSYFGGVPVHIVAAFLPLINNIFQHADPIEKRRQETLKRNEGMS